DHTINRREARSMGLEIETASDELYGILKVLHHSMTDEMKTRTPFSPDTELAGQPNCAYACSRVLIESVSHGSHQFLSEGTISRVQINQNGIPQVGIQDTRTFEGWRKVA